MRLSSEDNCLLIPMYLVLPLSVIEPAASKAAPANGPRSWLLFFCDAIGGVWQCCSFFLLSGRHTVANPHACDGC